MGITDQLTERLMQESKIDIINIMENALEEMQSYNGRSLQYCIVIAMGGELHYNDDGDLEKYTVPKFVEKSGE